MTTSRCMFALPAADLEASVAFFRDVVGLRITAEHPDEELPSVDFDLGSARLRVYRWIAPFSRGGHSGLLIATDELEAAVERAGAAAGEIRDEPWGGHVCTLSDPDGNRFDLLGQAYFENLP